MQVTSTRWTISPGTEEVMNLRLSGHDTFPLRYGWLYKAASFISQNNMLKTSKVEDTELSVVQLGVGKNMVNAIRYWAESVGVLKVNTSFEQSLTEMGELLFGAYGKDPYLERLGTVWLIHFMLNFEEENLTAYRYFFNYSNLQSFDKDRLAFDLDSYVLNNTEKSVNKSTIKKDVDCFLNTYCKKYKGSKLNNLNINEDYFSSPLTEIGILADLGKGFYLSEFSERNNLPTQIFIYGLCRFIRETLGASSASFESLLVSPYSPGRIFRLSESGLARHLDDAMRILPKYIHVTDTAGQRQVVVDEDIDIIAVLNDYWETSL